MTLKDFKDLLIFSDWTDSELISIMPFFDQESINKNHIIFSQGDVSNRIYFIKSGCIELKLIMSGTEEARLTRIKSGDMFGEMSVLDGKTRSATAIAFTDAVLISITKDNFYKLINKIDIQITNKLLINILKSLCSM